MSAQWEFIREFWLFFLLGIIAVVPLAMLTAALLDTSYSSAVKRVRKFLETWASFAGEEAWKAVLAVQVGGAVILLAMLAWALNRLGDATVPQVSGAFDHFGKDRVAWSLDYESEWDDLRHDFREVTGIGNDQAKYEEVKARLGSYEYSFFRTLFWLALILVTAGIVDLSRKVRRKRGTLEVCLGLLVAFASVAIWANRQDRFIGNMVSEYRDTHKHQTGAEPSLPAHYLREP